jgi:hypothetical protein
MDIHEAAAALDGNQYGNEGSVELFKAMKNAGLLAIYGASDDIAILNGAQHDEAYGKTLYFTPAGILKNDRDDNDCPYFTKEKSRAATVNVKFCEGEYTVHVSTDIPHAKFTIKEDDDNYCAGIVFALKDAIVAD